MGQDFMSKYVSNNLIRFGSAFLLLVILNNIVSAQKSKIVKILDSNLFELYDGSLIKLANLDVPNINHRNSRLREVGLNAYDYARTVLLNRSYEFIYPSSTKSDTIYKLVHIIKEYPLETRDYTKTYLENGFGKFLPNALAGDSLKYILAQQEASQSGEGIWEFIISKGDTLDQSFLGYELLTAAVMDSVYGTSFFGSLFVNSTNEERVLLEVISAPILGVPFAFLGGFLAAGLSSFGGSEGWDNLGYSIIGAYLGYTLGNAAAVYLIAKNGEKQVTFGETFLASAFGAGVGAALFLSADDYGGSTIIAYSPLILPGLAAIIYANIIADDNVENGYNNCYSISNHGQKSFGLTHQDLLNSKKIIEFNVFRINF